MSFGVFGVRFVYSAGVKFTEHVRYVSNK